MSEQGSSRLTGYVFVPANSIKDDDLVHFAAAIWPDRANPEKILSSWWRRAEPRCAVAAVHEATGVVSGVCAGVPSTWIISGQSLSAIAICVWYVSPQHAGKGLGKSLVQQYEASDVFMYAFSISDAAAANFTKLGWVGPYTSSLMALPLPRVAALPLSLFGRSGLDLSDYSVDDGVLPSLLGADLDRIEASRRSAPAHMRRGKDEWSWHLSIARAHSYRFCVAHRSGEPVGYAVVRRVTPGSSSQLGKLQAAMITDLVAVNDDPKVLRALAVRAVTIASELRAMILLTATTALAPRKVLSALGFVSPATPVVGRYLERRAPQFMWVPPKNPLRLSADEIALTFVDSDVDFNL